MEKMEEDDPQGRRTKNSTPLSQRDTPRKSLRRVTSVGTPSTPTPKIEDEDKVGGDITVKIEPGQAPKLARSNSKKIPSRPAPKFFDQQDAASEAKKGYESLDKCSYANKFLGLTDPALECDCTEEWDSVAEENHACGPDSDCINRATRMECLDDCGCGNACQNQRFQRKQYADVTVIKTARKGYGLRTNADLFPHDFIFEYIGEVIGEQQFQRRRQQYDRENIKHFYFMSLSKGEFVDATKKGNLGRFCNHSCNPNCYVDKWVVGDRLRMGIFAERKVEAGEELTFNYNVDRYGADPQPCYCDEPNCTGYIGGKTQTERGTKLSALVIEALGIDDADDWDTAVAKKSQRKKKIGEEDEEYVDSVQPRALDTDAVTKVMATLRQCKEKWIAVKLLTRLQKADDERVLGRVVRMHGYQVLKSVLKNFKDDSNVVLQVFDIFNRLPRITKNKIQDSKIEEEVEPLKKNDDEEVSRQAIALLETWSKLEVAYRIPRMKRDPVALAREEKAEREERRRAARDRERSKERSKSPDVPKGPKAPTGPKGGAPPRPAFRGPPPFRRGPPLPPLPQGWFAATNAEGKTYYYNTQGRTTWERPTAIAAVAPPPPPPKTITQEQKLQNIIESITKAGPTKDSDSNVATPVAGTPRKDEPSKPKEKWRSMSEAHQMKLYENTLFPHVKYVMDKYRGKLDKEDLKRLCKEVSKKLVNSDFKNKRIEDPTKISDSQSRKVKKYVKDFLDRAVEKKKDKDAHNARKAARQATRSTNSTQRQASTTPRSSPPANDPLTGRPWDVARDEEADASDQEMDAEPSPDNG
ncbi:MAG: hypothetical protein Q9159_005278, partial [Coniocarpon cinnabarinum]